MNTYDYNIQELWDPIKKPKLRIPEVEEEDEIRTKSIGNPFNEIIAENFPTPCNDINTHIH
jgi:hypothetical protein